MQDLERFVKNLTGLAETLREPALSEFRIESYRRVLEAFDDDQVEAALFEACSSLKFFPKPVELIELISGTRQDAALVAWGQLQEAVQRAGPYMSVLFADGKIARVIDLLGGWLAVCAWTVIPDEMGRPAEIVFRRKEFLDAYRALKGRDDVPGKVIGIHEANNAAHGYLEHIPEAIVIGAEHGRPALPRANRHDLVDRCITAVLADPNGVKTDVAQHCGGPLD